VAISSVTKEALCKEMIIFSFFQQIVVDAKIT